MPFGVVDSLSTKVPSWARAIRAVIADEFQGAYAVFLERDTSEVVIFEGWEGDADVAGKAWILRPDVVEK